jgi:DNA-binding HxlR family transcriptional regulator
MSVSKKPDAGRLMCPSRLVLEHVTSRWGVLVLSALLERSYRFSELRREVGGVSEKMLAQTLRTLERDGFVHREARTVIPPRVDYTLTGMGREAAEQVLGLRRWTERRLEGVLTAREVYDERRARAQAGAQGGPPAGTQPARTHDEARTS